MKSTGITRALDGLGRIVIPSELRRTLGLKENDPMEIFTEDDRIIIRKYRNKNECIVTGEVKDDNISMYDGKLVISKEGASQLIEKLGAELNG